MHDVSMSEAIFVAASDVARVLELYERGRCLEAYRESVEIGPLQRWSGPSALIVAGRLAMNLGAPRLASRLHLRAGRGHPDDFEARYYFARTLSHRRGPLVALAFMTKHGCLEGAEDYLRADWLAFRAILQGTYRDFDAAEASLAQAEAIKPDWPWVILERAHLFALEDRMEASLAASRHALEVRPWYRPGVQSLASSLVSLGRDREALELLTEAAERLENAPIVAQLGSLQRELGLTKEAAKSWELVAELSPLLEKQGARWLASRRSDSAYADGDFDLAAQLATESADPFYIDLARRIRGAPADARRVQTNVEFVRQHHQTCAPATLTSIARYWNKPAEHLDVAEAICYDGTPDHRERTWAVSCGWHVREFTVSWQSATALLDAGIPFTLTTIEVVSAHLQAVVGYDARRRTLLLRDPSHRVLGEVLGDGLVERYRSTGPRGMALVPAEQRALLDSIELPDAMLHDRLYQLQFALQSHDRASASTVFSEIESIAPEHRITLQAGRLLAIYDADSTRHLAYIDRLLALFPDDPLLQLSRLSALREHARRDERLAMLRAICTSPEADPVFRRQLAQELSVDAREQPTTLRLLQRCLRERPDDDTSLFLLASLRWDQRAYAEAYQLYRLTACLDDKNEGNARAYFTAARYLGRIDEALALLSARFQRYAARSSAPTRTLFWAMAECERTHEAFARLEQAMELRPDDGELLLFGAAQYANHGDFDRAAVLIESARGHSRQNSWCRAAATLAAAKGELPQARDLWAQVVETEPTAIDAQHALTRLLAETTGSESALEHLREFSDRFPHNYPLNQLYIQWLREAGVTAVEPVIQELVRMHPDDAWARRELAIVMSEQGRLQEALAELEFAERLEPANPAFLKVRGQAHARAGHYEEARDSFREVIKFAVDDEYAIGELVKLCTTRAERREVLEFIEAELANQVILGDGLLAYQRVARTTLDSDQLLVAIEKAWHARPDLWQTWSAYATQLNDAGKPDHARNIALQAVERFPLMPRLWADLALIENRMGDREREIAALTQALKISPGWSTAVRRLAEAYEANGDYEQSRLVLEKAVAHTPLDALNHGWLADALWHLGEKNAAIERVRRSVQLDPCYDWAWSSLRDWTLDLGLPDESAQLARELAEHHGGDSRVWHQLARVLDGPDATDERLAALDRAISLDPRSVDSHDLRAELLAESGRFDEARAAVRPAFFGEHLPLILKGRAAWIEAKAGRVDLAIESMTTTLEGDPDYYWGWRHQVEWLDGIAGTPPEAILSAAEHLVRLAPDKATSYGYRGDARVRANDLDGAKSDFSKALELSPQYVFVGVSLFDLQFQCGEYAAASKTINAIQDQDDNGFVLARKVQVAASLEEKTVATEHLRSLCLSPGDEPWPLEAAVQAMTAAGWAGIAGRILFESLERVDQVNPLVARSWVGLSMQSLDNRCLDRIHAWKDHPLLFEYALESFLRGAGKARSTSQVDRALRRFRPEIRASTKLWGMAGYALTAAFSRNKQARKFMSDWRERPDVEPWMLSNLVIALREANLFESAQDVGRHALSLPADFTTPYHRVWLAIDELIDGRWHEAEALLEAANADSLSGTHLAIARIVQSLLRFLRLKPKDQGKQWSRVLDELHETISSIDVSGEDRSAVRKTYRRATRAVARRMKSSRARLVEGWKSLRSPTWFMWD